MNNKERVKIVGKIVKEYNTSLGGMIKSLHELVG
jgi:hypothetical protein